uniref:Body wall globin n=1 Tax=Mermis nigrescens TaxID=70421 RepID=Q9N6K4_9BILA|nr:body wall globin [Mermis nigrescens]AAF35435.1 body wall globin [Mermis nigrescens]
MVVNLDIIRAQLAKLPINEINGPKFYVHMFSTQPDLRNFFKGSENIKPEEVPASARFLRQGQRLLLSMELMIELADKLQLFEPYVREMLDKHKRFKGIDYDLYNAFFDIWYGYLSKVIGLSDQEKKEWEAFKVELFLPAVKKYIGGW